MIVTDLNKASINELESINRALDITYEINDGRIVDTKIEKNKEENKK